MTNDLTGKVFTRLTVFERAGSNKFKKALWRCSCSCGNDYIAVGSALLSGAAKSCGCWRAEGNCRVTHGNRRKENTTPTYKVWCNMLSRCQNGNTPQYKDYGGRGIAVCERWKKFSNFLEDMGEAPDGLYIDRIDNDGGYSKDNCRWTTRSINRRNSRGHVVEVVIGEERMLVTDAVEKFKIVPLGTVYSRIHRGWEPIAAVLVPLWGNRQEKV